jgi:hypothetical protein
MVQQHSGCCFLLLLSSAEAGGALPRRREDPPFDLTSSSASLNTSDSFLGKPVSTRWSSGDAASATAPTCVDATLLGTDSSISASSCDSLSRDPRYRSAAAGPRDVRGSGAPSPRLESRTLSLPPPAPAPSAGLDRDDVSVTHADGDSWAAGCSADRPRVEKDEGALLSSASAWCCCRTIRSGDVTTGRDTVPPPNCSRLARPIGSARNGGVGAT